MARRLISLCDGDVTVALVDYRLTQPKPLTQWSDASKPVEYENRHPAHLEDVYKALRFLLLMPEDLSSKRKRDGDAEDKKAKEISAANRFCFDDNRVVLMGHSVGAWMVAAVLLDPRIHLWRKESAFPELGTAVEVDIMLPKINAWILVVSCARESEQRLGTNLLDPSSSTQDGIYDLISLLDEYPSYRSFVAEAFPLDDKARGSEAHQLRCASITSWLCREEDYCAGDGPRIWIAHSKDDELLSVRQSREAESFIWRVLAGRFDGQGRHRYEDFFDWEQARVEFDTSSWVRRPPLVNTGSHRARIRISPLHPLPTRYSGWPRCDAGT